MPQELAAHVIRQRHDGRTRDLAGNIADAMLGAADANVGGIVVLLGGFRFGGQQFSVWWGERRKGSLNTRRNEKRGFEVGLLRFADDSKQVVFDVVLGPTVDVDQDLLAIVCWAED